MFFSRHVRMSLGKKERIELFWEGGNESGRQAGRQEKWGETTERSTYQEEEIFFIVLSYIYIGTTVVQVHVLYIGRM